MRACLLALIRSDAYGRRAADALRGAVWPFQTDVLVSVAGQRRSHLGRRLRPAPDPDAIDTKTKERYLDAIPVDAVVSAARRYLS
jgi:hypothetical protein